VRTGRRQHTPARCLWRGGVELLQELHLTREAHGRRERLRVLVLHLEAERRKETAREKLHALRFVEVACAG
jgi:hypothetical protein